ncbi:MAG TPA: sigma-70 factor domain-containing protein, partial [Gaiellaceae bacterium]
MYEHDFHALLEAGEELGYVDAGELEALVETHELGEDELAELTHALDERGIELRTEHHDDDDDEPTPAVAHDFELPVSADSLQRFLAEMGRHELLTPAEEVALAKRVERGDPA